MGGRRIGGRRHAPPQPATATAQVPHDGWNYEAAVGLMVADLPVGGQTRHVVVSVPKQGFAYMYDAATGKFLAATQYTDIAWAKGLDKDGRPIENPDAMYWNRPGQDTLVLPGGMGAHIRRSPS